MAKKKSAAKSASTKRGAEKTKASKKSVAEFGVEAVAALIGNCLGLVEAGAIVESAVVKVGGIPPASYDVDKKLEKMGVITPNQCKNVKQRILNDVRDFPCEIDDGDVSFDSTTVARVIRDQVKDKAGKP